MNKPTPSEPSRAFPLLNVLMLVTALALMACLAYGLNSWLRDDSEITWFAPNPGCELHTSACSAQLNDGVLSFAVDVDGPIEALNVLPLEVIVQGVPARQASVEFIGRDMAMGRHHFDLITTAPGHFHGQGQVGLCTQAVMAWRARVVVTTPGGKIGSWFDFEVTRS
ncbi:hypothetical protein RN346_00760 [Halomonas sp. PAMB 3232]|uniref:hypothetical protein n=1 Tax=Halomonas sp. PAMB 3232 TaxID=3075221 RepID=UPI00289D6007|nr:hypothetical protein [Halomonas sp. PAMB 3232]WNL39117.1 hypothetical protein RN346_00760 [Halomonas sp. PAMB 3232]